MVLTLDKILYLLEKGRDKEIAEAVTHEERLRLHGEATMSVPFYGAFDLWLQDTALKLFNKNKADIFQGLITFPLPTVDLVEDAFKELYKVHSAANRVIDFYFSEDELKKDYQEYLEKIGEPQYWKTWGMEILKNHVNGLMVIDMPQLEVDEDTGEFIQESERPEPYFYFVPTEYIQCIKNDHQGNCEYVIYKVDIEHYHSVNDPEEVDQICIVLDELYYRRY